MASDTTELLDHVVDVLRDTPFNIAVNVAKVDFPDRQLEDLDLLYIDVYPGTRSIERSARWAISRTISVMIALRQTNISNMDDLLVALEQIEELVFSMVPPVGYSIVSLAEASRETYDIEALRTLNMFAAPIEATFMKVVDGP